MSDSDVNVLRVEHDRAGPVPRGAVAQLLADRDQARAENERLREENAKLFEWGERFNRELESLADCIRKHLPADVPEGSSVSALVVEAARLIASLEYMLHLQSGESVEAMRCLMRQNRRLRAALEQFADANQWRGQQPVVWVGLSCLEPWTIAHEALTPPAVGEATDG